MRNWLYGPAGLNRTVALALPLAGLACSFDATGNSAPTIVSGDSTSDTAATGTSTTDPPPTSTEPQETLTTAGPTDPPTSAPLDTTDPPLTDTTEPTLTTEPATGTTGTTGPVDPTLTDGSEGTSTGPAAVCGDGEVQGGEACDDGNDDDDDACVAGCVAASCGDTFTHKGVEECDDGNDVESDGCTFECKKPTCTDMAKNGDETDADCGGGCPKCATGLACDDDNDCVTGNCDAGVCHPPLNCEEIKSDGMPSGAYTIDPDQAGMIPPFMVWCDNDTQGGGWTLVLKADGTQTTFAYESAQWSDPLPYMPDPDLSRNETKLLSYTTVQVREILIGVEAPIGVNGDPVFKHIVLNPADGLSLFAMMSSGAFITTPNQENTWRMLMPGNGSLQANCKRQGLNVKGDNAMPNTYARVRLGIIANDQNNCDSVNSWIGVGGDTIGSNCNDSRTSTVGNRAEADCDAQADADTKAFAAVFVR